MSQYQLNPLMEFVGHVLSGFTGGIYGALKTSELTDKESFKLYKEKLASDPNLLKSEVASYIATEKKLIFEYQKDIEYSKQEYQKLINSNDPLEREEAQWFSDISEFEEKIKRCNERINEIKKLLLTNDTDYLITLLFNYRTKLASELKNKVANKHKLRGNMLTYGGMIGGTLGYHYAKKGLRKLIKKI